MEAWLQSISQLPVCLGVGVGGMHVPALPVPGDNYISGRNQHEECGAFAVCVPPAYKPLQVILVRSSTPSSQNFFWQYLY